MASTTLLIQLRKLAARLKFWDEDDLAWLLMEPIRQPSDVRLRALGLCTALGHPLFYVMWKHWVPQPYENAAMRSLMSLLGVVLLAFPSLAPRLRRDSVIGVSSLIFWLTLPWCFAWFYFANGFNAMWGASLLVAIMIYFHLTDVRIATLGTIAALPLAWLAVVAGGFHPVVPGAHELATHAVMFGFTLVMGLVLGVSVSNIQREQLNYTLSTIGILAHELRTPLMTINLASEALRSSSPENTPLADRLHQLVRQMNHQIDTQISNARLLRLPRSSEVVQAAELVAQAVAAYPCTNERQRRLLRVQVIRDFSFSGSTELFAQVVSNLVQNAMRAMAALPVAPADGDLRVIVDSEGMTGSITVQDTGVGIGQEALRRMFKPFFSTNRGTGHGLGLAFCKRVVASAGGRIRVSSQPMKGATFVVELPVLQQGE